MESVVFLLSPLVPLSVYTSAFLIVFCVADFGLMIVNHGNMVGMKPLVVIL